MPTPASELRPIDPMVWRACAGYSVMIPTVGSRAYYFPQGHAEQASSDPDLCSVKLPKPYLLSRVIFVKFLADRENDQVFVKIGLDPRPTALEESATAAEEQPQPPFWEENTDGIVTQSFAKILTQSDANNGGGFSVPRFCAETIFPPLDITAETPVQNLTVRDLVGKEWGFRHIYRGTPRRHLLTTGWSRFVNEKKLVAGDSVVFIKNRDGEIFIGIRRRLCKVVANVQVDIKGFVRNGRGRVPAEAVVEAVRAAAEADRVYEVDYYPGKGSPEFVVAEEVVAGAKSMVYPVGSKVRMAVETEDAKRMSWFYGVISRLIMTVSGPWAYSPWRILEINWEDSDFMKNVGLVNPWQVQLDLLPSTLDTSYLATKKLRISDYPVDVYGCSQDSVDGFGNSFFSQISPSLSNFSAFPIGMQGVRQDPNIGFSLSNFPNGVDGSSILQILTVSAVPPSNRSLEELSSLNFPPKRTKEPFYLFGQVIPTKQVDETNADTDANNQQEQKEGEDKTPSADSSSPKHPEGQS